MLYILKPDTKIIPETLSKVIVKLDCSNNDYFDNDQIKKMAQLRELSLKCNDTIGDAAAGKLTLIRKINLGYNRQIDSAVLAFAELKDLDLSFNAGVTAATFQKLITNDKIFLENLSLEHNFNSLEKYIPLIKNKTTLKFLNLRNCYDITWRDLQGFDNIVELNLINNQNGKMKDLDRMRRLKILHYGINSQSALINRKWNPGRVPKSVVADMRKQV